MTPPAPVFSGFSRVSRSGQLSWWRTALIKSDPSMGKLIKAFDQGNAANHAIAMSIIPLVGIVGNTRSGRHFRSAAGFGVRHAAKFVYYIGGHAYKVVMSTQGMLLTGIASFGYKFGVGNVARQQTALKRNAVQDAFYRSYPHKAPKNYEFSDGLDDPPPQEEAPPWPHPEEEEPDGWPEGVIHDKGSIYNPQGAKPLNRVPMTMWNMPGGPFDDLPFIGMGG